MKDTISQVAAGHGTRRNGLLLDEAATQLVAAPLERESGGKPDAEEMRERGRIVHVLRNLLYYLTRNEWTVGRFCSVTCRIAPEFEEVVDVERGIRSLPPDLRKVVSLIGLQGLTELEVSLKLDCSARTVKRHLWRAAELIQLSWRRPAIVRPQGRRVDVKGASHG